MAGIEERQELLKRLVDGFAGEPEIYAIYAFGRQVDGVVDEFSDIDMILCSSDLPRTQQRYQAILATIAPIMGSYYIRCEESVLAQMILLEGYSPYQKIDLGVVDSIERNEAMAPFQRLYGCPRVSSGSAGAFTFHGQRECLGNWLNDLLFSVPRFTKCLFRQDRDLYRRWTGLTEAMMVLLLERYCGWMRTHRYRLDPHEYKRLHQSLTAEHTQMLERIVPMAGTPDIISGFQVALEVSVNLYAQKAVALAEVVDLDLAQYMTRFLACEIERYRQRCL
jgi:hypothetical protein